MNFEWDPEKNEQIKKDHDISFEDVVALIAKGCLVTTVNNPSPNYKGQKIFLIKKGKAIYMFLLNVGKENIGLSQLFLVKTSPKNIWSKNETKKRHQRFRSLSRRKRPKIKTFKGK